MNRTLRLFNCLTFLLFLGSLKLMAQPANDNCANAISVPVNLTCGTLESANTANATMDNPNPGYSCWSSSNDDDIWYTFVTPSVANDVTINVSNYTYTTFDAGIGFGLFTGCSGTPDVSGGGCQFNPVGGVGTYTFYNLLPNTTYYLALLSPSTGVSISFDFCLTYTLCPPPTNLYISNKTMSSVDINWSGTNTYILEYGPAGFTPGSGNTPGPGGTIISPATSPQNISGLTQSTPYDVYVRNDCSSAGNGYSANAAISFTTSAPPAANDDCINAMSLAVSTSQTCNTSINANNTGCTVSSDPAPTCASNTDNDVWFSFVATAANQLLNITNVVPDDPNNSYNYVGVTLYSGSCGAFTEEACDAYNAYNDFGQGNTPFILPNLIVNNTYYLRVWSSDYYMDPQVSFDICITELPPPPANDDCAGAVMLTPSSNSACSNPTQGTLTSASPSAGPVANCGDFGDDVWYSFIATTNTHGVQLNYLNGTTSDYAFQVLDACGAVANEIVCSDPESATFTNLVVNNTYYVRVASYSSTAQMTDFEICITTPPPPPLNDQCANAIIVPVNITCGTLESANTASATMDNPNPGYSCWSSSNDDDIWYTFTTPPTANDVTINVSNYTFTPYDPQIGFGLFTGCSGTPDVSGGACQFAAPGGSGSYTFTGLTPNTTYYLALLTPGTGVSIAFDFCLTYTLCPPPTSVYESNLTMGSVDINWTGTNTYVLEYGPSGYTPGSGPTPGAGGTMIAPATSPQNISGLNPSTSYDVYIRNDCSALGNGYSTDVMYSFTTLPPPPANDDCSGVVMLTPSNSSFCGTPTQGTITSATPSAGPFANCGDFGDDVWYSFVATTNTHGVILNYLSGNTGDYAFQVLDACGPAANEIICSDPESAVFTNLTINNTYYVRVASYSSSPEISDFEICITSPPPPPLNDQCANAIAVAVNLTCGTLESANTASATMDNPNPGYSCWSSSNDDDIWYTFTTPSTANDVTINVNNYTFAPYDPQIGFGLFTGCSGTPDVSGGACQFAATNGSGSYTFTGLTPSTTYYLALLTPGTGVSIAFDFCLTYTLCPPPMNMSVSNVTLSDADISWTGTGSYILEYGPSGYTPGTGSTAGAGGTLISPASSPITLTGLSQSTSYDVYVRNDCSGLGNGYSTNTMASFVTLGPPPVNDACANAISVPVLGACTSTTTATTANATMDNPNPGYSCWSSSNDDDVWYTFTTPAGVTSVTIDVSNYTFFPFDPGGVGYGLFTACSGTPDVSGGNCTFPISNGTGSYTFTGLFANTTYYLALLTSGTGVSISFDFCLSNNVLAIKLDKITATNIGASNRIDWNTLSEEKTDKFELQRSRDGKTFKSIATIDTKGEASQYSYIDNAPEKGTNFYRLMMKEVNGAINYSDVVKAVVGKSTAFSVDAYPNPVSDILTVKISGTPGDDATVQITDVTGKVLRAVLMSGTESKINMSGLASGIYLVKYSDADHSQTVRITKQ